MATELELGLDTFGDVTNGADGTPLTGRGWAVLQEDKLNGMIVIHQGDESEFGAEREVVEGD